MKTYTVEEINRWCLKDPKDFILSCEDAYDKNIDETAKLMKRCLPDCPIILLSGPSSSGKTTTAHRIKQSLATHGVTTHTISMDDYYRTRKDYVMPVDENGNPDLESPHCMDLPLLNEHLLKLAAGDKIDVPKFDFERQCRSEETERIQLKKGEIAIIEGIHALNDIITGNLSGLVTSVYISVGSEVIINKEGSRLVPQMLRFPRRVIRDKNFRGASISRTLELWPSVTRGEELYIKPFIHNASVFINTYMPYESCILMNILKNELKSFENESKQAGLSEVYYAMDKFEPIDFVQYIPENSILHEFIG